MVWGKKNEIIDVRPGYARYLLTKNKAWFYNDTNKVLMEQMEKDRAEEILKKHQKRLEIIKQLSERKEMFFYVPAGDSGKIFGRITRQKIKDKFQEMGFDVPTEHIIISENITTLGSYNIIVSFGSGMASSDKNESTVDENTGLTTMLHLHIKDATQDPSILTAQKEMLK